MTFDKRTPLAALLLVCAACDEPGGQASSQLDGGDARAGNDADANIPNDVNTPNDTAPDGQVGPASLVDPSCVDGQFSEAIGGELVDIGDLVASYSEANYLSFVDAVLERRYPVGGFLVDEGVRLGQRFGNCVELFTSRRGQASTLMRELSTAVHECGHIADLSLGGFSENVFIVTENLRFECNRGDTTTRGGDTFARSLLNGDDYAALLPDDFYKDVYLDGDPADSIFESGDQGFNSVLEEALQYVNSLATDYYFRDQLGGFSISAKDGILTFLWYIQRYLRMARLDFPQAYDRLTTDSCWRESILTLWGRAWLYLEAARSTRQLGINADDLEELVSDPNLLDEIERVRTAHGCR